MFQIRTVKRGSIADKLDGAMDWAIISLLYVAWIVSLCVGFMALISWLGA